MLKTTGFSFFEFMEYFKDATYVTDEGYNIVFWNIKAEAFYGIPSHEAIGKNVSELIGGLGPAGSSSNVQSTLSTTGKWNGLLNQKHAKGHSIPVTCDIATYQLDNGGPGYLFFARNPNNEKN